MTNMRTEPVRFIKWVLKIGRIWVSNVSVCLKKSYIFVKFPVQISWTSAYKREEMIMEKIFLLKPTQT